MSKRRKNIMILISMLIFQLVLFNFCTMEPIAAGDLTTKLKENLIHIKTTKAESGYEDLEPLKEILKDKRIIGIGESTLGAKEFYEIKHRLVEFLVEEMGYRVFAIDAEFADVKIVNDYIVNGNGNLEDAIWAIRHLAWSPSEVFEGSYEIKYYPYIAPYTNVEAANMIEWMKKFNENPANEQKIKFYGIDMELARESIEYVLNYIGLVDKDNEERYRRIWQELLSPDPDMNQSVPKAAFSFYFPENWQLNSLYNIVVELKEYMNNNKDEYIRKSSYDEYGVADQNLNIIIQWIEYREKNLDYKVEEAQDIRYYNMAKNIEWILNHEDPLGNDKIIVWAHNRYISKKGSNYISMGECLDKTFGDEYYAIGLDFYKGRFRAYGVDLWGTPISHYLGRFNVGSSSRKTIAYEFEKTGIPLSFLDFKSVEDKELLDFLSNSKLIHDIGIMYPGKIFPSKYLNHINKRFSNEIPMKSYDGFIFIKEISGTTGLKDKRDTKLENGDKAILSYYIHMFYGQIATIVGGVILIIYTALYIRKKVKDKIEGKGARYPGER